MPVVALIGTQWGDEGKGHVVDWLAEQANLVVRYGGGNNAGHTVVNEHGTFQLHTVPSGIFDPQTVNVIGHAVAIDPEVLLQELDMLLDRGVSLENLYISDRAHIVMPYHVVIDQHQEAARGNNKIGTTGRGIGPAYADKMSRVGIRAGDLLDEQTLLRRLQLLLEDKNRLLTHMYDAKPMTLQKVFLRYVEYGTQLSPHITNVHPIVHRAINQNSAVLLEGAQGALLDIDMGTYPFVTSSPPGAAGACQGAGIGPTAVSSVVGVCKAYLTRVGSGPFPTELSPDDPAAQVLLQLGKPWAEVGTTTGRQRRVGWFDAMLGRYAVETNGIDTLALTKLDVLDEMDAINICVAYRQGDELLETPPASIAGLERVEPVYETLPGWKQPTSTVRHFADLPANAQHYVLRLCELLGVRLGLVTVGPERDQTITIEDIF